MTSKDWLRNFERSHISFFFLIKTFQKRILRHWPEKGGVGFFEQQRYQNTKPATPINSAKAAETLKGVATLLTEVLLPVEKEIMKRF